MMTAPIMANGYLLSELLKGICDHDLVTQHQVSGLNLDSNKLRAGDLFLACAGSRSHGLLHAEQAVKKGAAAIVYELSDQLPVRAELVAALARLQGLSIPVIEVHELHNKLGLIAERFYGNPSHAFNMVGITGTNGKTSCSHFLAQILTTSKVPCGVIGTLGNGIFGKLVASTHTTPDAITLHSLFADMRDAGVEYVSMEVSSHGLEQGRVSGVQFQTAVFTNLTRDHLDYHGDMQAYAQSKRSLFEQPGLQYAVINADDEFGRELLAGLPDDVQSVAYSLSDASNAESAELRDSVMHLGCVQASDLHFSRDGMRMQVTTPWGDGGLSCKLIGRFNASNILAVLVTVLLSGMRLQDALESIRDLQSVPGRMQLLEKVTGFPLTVIDYAHTPDALQHVLEALRTHCKGQLWCVFGCGGDRDRGKRPLMGAIVEKHADQIILTDDNPRTENSADIIEDIRNGLQDPDKAYVEPDRRLAIIYALKNARPDDVVLIAGKGHEDYQITGKQRLPFSDAEVVSDVFARSRQ